MASGSSGRPTWGSKGFDFGSDDILCSYGDFANQESSNGTHSDPVPYPLRLIPAMQIDDLCPTLSRVLTNAGCLDHLGYDGIRSDETLRMIAAASKTRLYLKYVSSMAEKTDFGRLASPSILRLLDEALDVIDRSSLLNGPRSSEIWDILEKKLEEGSSVFADPYRFGCFLVMDPSNLDSALRYWGVRFRLGQ